MKKTAILLVLLMALSIATPVLLSTKGVNASPVPTPKTVVWEGTAGLNNALSLLQNPEYLKLHTTSSVLWHSTTTIHVTGLDEYNKSIEAEVTVPQGTHGSGDFIFKDPHTNLPVAFSQITGIFQENGTESTFMEIDISPFPFEQYLGMYEPGTGFEPGQYYYLGSSFYGSNPLPAGQYWQGNGPNTTPTKVYEPVQPANPDPIKIVINWYDANNDLNPQTSEIVGSKASAPVNLTIEGLDQQGDKWIDTVTIHNGEKIVYPQCSWADCCKVWGGDSQDEYEIFTHPNNATIIPLFKYYIWIDHVLLYPKYYDILGNGNVTGAGSTLITAALADQDGHLVHADSTVILNWWTSGGHINPSYNSSIPLCNTYAYANLTADSNPRTIKVVVDANVPADKLGPGVISMGERNLMAWTEMCFDGVNSVGSSQSTWHPMQCGYDALNYSTGTYYNVGPMNAPFEPALEEALDTVTNAPDSSILPPYKFDGPIYEVTIPFWPGCNLISCPVHPIMANYTCEAYGGQGIPMKMLFGNTSATETIEAIWWYTWNDTAKAMQWYDYIPGKTMTNYNFTDGIGYWIKAIKAGTFEISGVIMENAPFTPPEYKIHPSWNLMGFTSVTNLPIGDYLQSLSANGVNFYGPVWVYYANYRSWVRNPSWGFWPTEAFWVYYKDNQVLDHPKIAP